NLQHELVAESLHPATHAHEIAALKTAGQQVGVTERSGGDRPAAIAQLKSQIRASGARGQAVLAHAGEDTVDLFPCPQGTHQLRSAHTTMMYGDPDAATPMGTQT